MITQKQVLKAQHRPIDLQRPVVDGHMMYQAVCWCGRKAAVGSRSQTQSDQKDHRWQMIREYRERERRALLASA
jgi:hypothetical protein